MAKPWNWSKQLARLGGNFLVSFGTPLTGGIAVTQEFYQSLLIAIISSSIWTGINLGKTLDEWSRRPC